MLDRLPCTSVEEDVHVHLTLAEALRNPVDDHGDVKTSRVSSDQR
jgi:hypothetical protein